MTPMGNENRFGLLGNPNVTPDERKLVTALVVGIAADPDAAGDPEEVRARTDQIMTQAAERIRHYGGGVQTSTMGQLLAVFGADRAHEDDPERAVRAALDILGGDPHDDGKMMRGGVATGEAVVTRAADSLGQVIGDVIHLAVTLQQNAPPGGVLVNTVAYQATSRVFSYDQVAPAGVLERSSGMLLWRALEPRARTGAQAHHGPDTPLVEREYELGLLTDVLVRFLRDRQPQFLTLVSDPGLGKSRLVAELARLVDKAPELVGWRVGHARAYGHDALGPLVEIISAELGVHDDDAATTRRRLDETVTDLLGKDATQVAESLGHLLGASAAEGVPSRPQARFGDWAAFLAAVAEQRPLVLVCEDLQWADDVLLEFASGLPDRVGPVPLLLVATGRPEFLDRWSGWGGGLRNAVTTTLAPLSREGTRRLLETLLDGTPMREATMEALLDAAGGNPLYVEEYVRMLAEQPAHAVAGARALAMPTSVQQVIAARLDTLEDADKRLLQDAAVIGETCFLGQLVKVARAGREDVVAGLRRLERRGFLRRLRVSSIAGETEYVFRHALVRDVAYTQLLRQQRSVRHERAAEWVATLSPEPGDRLELLAYHYQTVLELAEALGTADPALTDRARRVLRAAGDRAMSLGALPTAARHFAAALDRWPADDPDRPRLLLQLGKARTYHDLQGGAELLAARDGFIAAGDQVGTVQATVQLALLARNSGDAAAAKAHLDDALKLCPADETVRVMAMSGHALELAIRGELAEAISVGGGVASSAAELGLAEEEAYALNGVGIARLRCGDVGGEADLTRSIELFEQALTPNAHFTRWSLAQHMALFGDLRRAGDLAAEGRQRAVAWEGGPAALITRWFAAVTADVDYGAGRWDAVDTFVAEVLADAGEERRNPEPWIRPLRGRVRLGRGDVGGALEDAEQGEVAAGLVGETRMLQPCRALTARALLAGGRRDEAAAVLDELLAAQRQDPPTAVVTPDQAVVMVELGRGADALPEDLWPTRWHQAARLLAARDFAGAADAFATIGSEADEATARLYLARTLAEAGRVDDARTELDAAAGFWRRAGASAYLAQAEALAAELTTPRAARGGRG